MNPKPLSQARDADARNITAALQRAGQRARMVAEQTQTAIVVVRNGQLIRETPINSKRR